MRATKTIILLLVIIINNLLTSCNESPASKLLTEADSIIETEPDKALNMLSDIHPDNLSQDEFPYYSLLYPQAQIKCGINVSSDSLIRNAVDYYANDNSRNRKIRAYFYYAKIAHNGKNLQDAMKYVLIAYELAKENKVYFWIAKSAELISDIFFEAYNYAQAEIYTLEAIDNYALSNKNANQRYALCDLATIYLNENRNSQAVTILDSLYTVCINEVPIDTTVIEYLKEPRLIAKIETGQLYDLSECEINILSENATNDEKIDDSIRKSQLCITTGDLDSSHELLSDAHLLATSDEQRAVVLYAKYQHAKTAGNYYEAATLADTLLYLQSEIAETILKESVTGVQRDFYSEKAIRHKNKSKQLIMVLSVVILIAITMTILLLIIFRLKNRNRKTELESAMTSLLYLKEQSQRITSQNKILSDKLKEKNETVTELKKELCGKLALETQNAQIIETLFKEKWTTLNMLCNQYFDMGSSEKTRNAILYNIEQELEKLQSKKSLRQLEDAVNNYLGGIMSLLRNECLFLKEDDFTFLSLIFAGFSVRAVCLFTNIKYKLFYLKKARLTKKISESEAPHKHIFLDKLS